MAQCVQIDQITGVLTASAQDEVSCSTYLLSTAAEYHQMFAGITGATLEMLGIDPATILYVYSWGMGSVLFFWSLGYAIGAATGGVNKV
jgi:hypothetical protein